MTDTNEKLNHDASEKLNQGLVQEPIQETTQEPLQEIAQEITQEQDIEQGSVLSQEGNQKETQNDELGNGKSIEESKGDVDAKNEEKKDKAGIFQLENLKKTDSSIICGCCGLRNSAFNWPYCNSSQNSGEYEIKRSI